jgi:hypothetical protein
MKKKIALFLVLFIAATSFLLILSGNANPDYGEDPYDCHSSDGYTIETFNSSSLETEVGEVFQISIKANGIGVVVQIHPAARDNKNFTFQPGVIIADNSLDDLDPEVNSISLNFTITSPAQEGNYEILILAKDSVNDQPNLAFLEFDVNVGGVAPPPPTLINIFDHFELFFGLPALILLTVGTILVLINENKFVKIHGIFSGASWILTLTNVLFLITLNPAAWWSFQPFSIHIIHIVLGATGLFGGFFSMLFGIAAERKPAKVTGFIALGSWWSAFFLGLLLVL